MTVFVVPSFSLALLLCAALWFGEPVHGAGLIYCYAFNGSAYANNTRCPGSNACCDYKATCLSNRLCHNPSDGPGTYVRGPCAVYPYDSGTCAQICLYDEVKGYFPRVRICSDGSLCCDNDSHCCEEGRGIFLDNNGLIADSAPTTTFSYGPERTAATFRTQVTSSETTSLLTSASTLTPTPTPTPSSSEREDKDDDKDGDDYGNGKVLVIALGVSIPVVCIALALAAFWFFRKRRANRRARTSPVHTQSLAFTEQKAPERPARPVELEADPSSMRPIEMPG